MLYWSFLPDVAVLAAGLASVGGVDHELGQPFVAWPHDVVEIE